MNLRRTEVNESPPKSNATLDYSSEQGRRSILSSHSVNTVLEYMKARILLQKSFYYGMLFAYTCY